VDVDIWNEATAFQDYIKLTTPLRVLEGDDDEDDDVIGDFQSSPIRQPGRASGRIRTNLVDTSSPASLPIHYLFSTPTSSMSASSRASSAPPTTSPAFHPLIPALIPLPTPFPKHPQHRRRLDYAHRRLRRLSMEGMNELEKALRGEHDPDEEEDQEDQLAGDTDVEDEEAGLQKKSTSYGRSTREEDEGEDENDPPATGERRRSSGFGPFAPKRKGKE